MKTKKFKLSIMLSIFVLVLGTALTPISAQQGPELRLSYGGYSDQGDPAVDSNGNVHIVYSSDVERLGSFYRIFGTSPNRYTVIEWDTEHYSDDDPGKFQVILYENGTIEFNIADNTGAVGVANITGVNQGDGIHGVDIGGTAVSNTSYRFTWNSGTSDYNWTTISYNWTDASGGNFAGADGHYAFNAVPVGFNFTFYGTSYSTVYVSSAGFMSFTDNTPSWSQPPAGFPIAAYGAWYDPLRYDHIIAPLWADWSTGTRTNEICYKMLDNNGNTLIQHTLLTADDDEDSRRPAIVVDSNDKVHIIWHDKSEGNAEIYYTKLDPYLDDRDGDAADEAAIILIADKRISTDNSKNSRACRMAIDADNNMHIVWEEEDANIFYAKIDNNGNKLIRNIVVYTYGGNNRSSVDIAVDSDNNPHIAWNDDDNTGDYETYYKMLNGSDGSTLIDRTLITPDDSESSKGQSILVDGLDMVHIIWKDQRGDGQAVYYTKLDPSLDDQNGDAADETVITLIDDKPVSTDASDYKVKRIGSAIGCGTYIHISWWEDYDDDDRGNLYYMVLDTDGIPQVPETVLTTTTASSSTDRTVPYLDVDANGKAHITWCDESRYYHSPSSYSTYNDVFYTTYQGPTCGATSSIQGTVWADPNGNGQMDSGEPRLGNWLIELINASGSVVQTTHTDPSGAYSFTELSYGPYVVRQSPTAGWTQTYPSFRTDFTAGPVTGDWGYVDDPAHGLHGPARWHLIAPDAAGYFQSPIDLPSTNTTDLSSVLSVHYEPTVVEAIFNNGHTIEAEYPHHHNNHLEAAGEEFELLQFHFHSLSENAVDGSLYDMEAHFVHKHADGGLSVIGVWLTAGAFNAEYDKVFQYLSSLEHQGDEVHPTEAINAAVMLPGNMTGWFFEGSLTTPPCSQPVNWFMLATPVELSQSQIDAYRAAAEDSDPHHDFNPGNRPLQLLNGRQFNELNHEVTLNSEVVADMNFGVTQPPTVITLVTFNAVFENDQVTISWTTESEANNAGFNIYRSQAENGEYIKINDAMIPSQGNATTGASYSFIDTPEQSGNFFYKLQDVGIDGQTTFHGPVQVAGVTAVEDGSVINPDKYQLFQNHPNPFNPNTEIRFTIPNAGNISIKI